ncbi:MAG: hypothetical protein AAGJ83_02510 [Planctomycetota bacterium]
MPLSALSPKAALHRVACLGAFLAVSQLAVSRSQAADRSDDKESTLPAATRLLPTDTMVYLHLDDAEQLRQDLSKSSIGRMIDDPKLRPFADQFYSTARDLFDMISDEVGVNLDELLAIPNGQVAFAVHPSKPLEDDEKPEVEIEDDDPDRAARRRASLRRREAYGFGVTLIVQAGDRIDELMRIIDRFEQALGQGGLKRRVRKIDGTDLVRYLPSRPGREPIEFFERDSTLVIGVGNHAAEDVLNHWLGDNEEPTLADNATFGTTMSRCVGAESTRPQITFFVDPHAIIDRAIKRSGSMTAGFVWPLIEEMGASRFGGIGGSSFTGGDVFEGIAHYHIKIDPPRDGVLGVLRPETGDTTPPDWVPETVAGYTSLHWDIAQTYENVGKVIDRFQGADSLKRFVEEPVKTRLGLDLQADILENVTGRLVRVAWMQKPIRVNSAVSAIAIELKDATKAKSTIAKIRERMPNQLMADSVSGNVWYRFRGPGDNFPKQFRKPEPGFVIIDKWLIYSDSKTFMEKAALASAGNLPRLTELPDYDLVASELGGKLNGEKPFFLSFIDGAQGMRFIYDLIKDDNSKNFLRMASENNVVARQFSQLLDQNELPPFSEFEKYFAPTGMFGYDEADGIHFGFFTLRADLEDE